MSQLLEKADKAYSKKNYDYAIELWSQHLKLKPDDLETRKKLRKCMREGAGRKKSGWFSKVRSFGAKSFPVNKKDPESTMHKCEDTLKDDPSNAGLLVRLGEACALANHHEVAIWVFKDAITIDKKNKEAHRQAARSCVEIGEIEKAIEHYEKIVKLDPSDGEAGNEIRNLSARNTSSTMQKKTAQGGGFQALIDKDKAGKLERLGQRVRTSEQARERILDLQEELEKEPDNIKYMMLIADMYTMVKEFSDAKEWLEKVIEFEPDDNQAHEKLGDLRLKQYDAMISKLKPAARKDPAAKAKYEKVNKERQTYQIKEYRRRFEAAPTELKFAFLLGKALHDMGDYDEAISMLQKAKSDTKYKVEGGYYLGLCLSKKKNLRMAVKELEAARADLFDMDDDNNKMITYLLGRIYEGAGKKDKSLEEYEKIGQVDYNYKDIQKRMDKMGGF
jgi:tetratricopeptide (TPR) repeat protein